MQIGYHITDKDPRLARYIPNEWDHVEKYPLTASTMPAKPVPVPIGINWYSNFDHPVKDRDGKYWVGKDKNNLGVLRGGHCVCVPHRTTLDLESWYLFYNQLREGKCVGEGTSRAMSLLNRKRYNVDWLWNRAKEVDEWADTNPGDNNGTSVKAAMDVLRLQGHMVDGTNAPALAEGIIVNRWARNVDQVFEALQNAYYKRIAAFPHLNSWGKDYPRVVWMPAETHQLLMDQQGEYAIITDR